MWCDYVAPHYQRINNNMRTSDLFHQPSKYSVLHERCSTFINESQQHPLVKHLPTRYQDCQRVKVRQSNTQNYMSTPFNEAFDQQARNIQQRAIFARTVTLYEQPTMDEFYIFPIDGYKFIYSKEVSNSLSAFSPVFDSLVEQYGENEGEELLTELLRFSYTNKNLAEGISSGSEIVLYNIPFYYAVRASNVPSYQSLILK